MGNVSHGPSIVTDGLVLCLDTYNEQSYLGQPTTNNKADISDWTVGADGSPSGGQGTVTFSSDGYLANVVNVNQNVKFSSSLYVTANGTYTHSMKFRLISGSLAWNTISFYMYTTGHGSHWVWASGADSMDLTNTTEWQTVEHTWTMTGGSTLMNFYIGAQAGVAYNNSFEIKDIQIEEKPHATKWVDGTRSATDGWQDLSGGGNHLSLNQLAYDSTNVPGTNVNEFSFDGIDDYAQNISNLNTIDDIFASGGTIEMAVNSTDGEGNILNKYHVTGWYCQLHSPSGGNTRFRLDHDFDGATDGSWRTGHVIPVGEYTFITATYNRDSTSNDAVIYINGISTTVSELSTPAGTADSDAGDRLTIGKDSWNNVSHFEGKIDMVRLYNRTLSASEVLQNFESHKGRYGL